MGETFIILFLVVLAAAAAAGIFWWYRKKLRLRLAGERVLDSVFLEVLMPRETTTADKEKEAAHEEKEIIAVAEQLFATLAHTEKRDFSTFLRGHETISFEIVSL